MIQIFHNSRCGKSRKALSILDEKGIKYEVINYLEESLTFDDLVSLLRKLDLKPLDLIRQKEKIWLENFKGKALSHDDIIMAMVSNPILIERPILVYGDKAIIARDIDTVEGFL